MSVDVNKELQERIEKLKNGAFKDIEKKHGKGTIILGEGDFPKVDIVCSTGSIGLDDAIGIGGFPKGRVIEVVGQESCGKSTLTLINIAEIQRNGKICAYIDGEQAFDPTYAQKLGVDVDNLIITQPDTMEEAFDIMHSFIKSKLINYIVYDSTNSLLCKRVFEGEVGDANMGRSALLMSQEIPKVVHECSDTNCSVIFLSQVRSKIGVMFGSPEVYGVGNALKFYASIRIKVKKSDLVKSDEEGQESINITANIFKNKVAPPYKSATFTLLTGKDGRYGIDTFKEIIQFAVQFELVKKGGAWYKFSYNNHDESIQGESNLVNWFIADADAFKWLKDQVVAKLKEKNEFVNVPVVGSFAAIKAKEEIVKSEKKVRIAVDKAEKIAERDKVDLKEVKEGPPIIIKDEKA